MPKRSKNLGHWRLKHTEASSSRKSRCPAMKFWQPHYPIASQNLHIQSGRPCSSAFSARNVWKPHTDFIPMDSPDSFLLGILIYCTLGVFFGQSFAELCRADSKKNPPLVPRADEDGEPCGKCFCKSRGYAIPLGLKVIPSPATSGDGMPKIKMTPTQVLPNELFVCWKSKLTDALFDTDRTYFEGLIFCHYSFVIIHKSRAATMSLLI